MKNTVYFSYDLSSEGDYSGLYTWLDSKEAVECGDSFAKFDYDVADIDDMKEFARRLRTDLKNHVQINDNKDRIYLVWGTPTRLMSAFLVGNRKQAPWTGYSIKTPENEKL